MIIFRGENYASFRNNVSALVGMKSIFYLLIPGVLLAVQKPVILPMISVQNQQPKFKITSFYEEEIATPLANDLLYRFTIGFGAGLFSIPIMVKAASPYKNNAHIQEDMWSYRSGALTLLNFGISLYPGSTEYDHKKGWGDRYMLHAGRSSIGSLGIVCGTILGVAGCIALWGGVMDINWDRFNFRINIP